MSITGIPSLIGYANLASTLISSSPLWIKGEWVLGQTKISNNFRVINFYTFSNSVILSEIMGEKFKPKFVAGHSLGELSALTAIGTFAILNPKKAQANSMPQAPGGWD